MQKRNKGRHSFASVTPCNVCLSEGAKTSHVTSGYSGRHLFVCVTPCYVGLTEGARRYSARHLYTLRRVIRRPETLQWPSCICTLYVMLRRSINRTKTLQRPSLIYTRYVKFQPEEDVKSITQFAASLTPTFAHDWIHVGSREAGRG